MRILYSSLVDVSVPYGPGVNERGFIKDMGRVCQDEFRAIIPRPANGLPTDLCDVSIGYISYLGSVRTVPGWLESRIIGTLRLYKEVQRFAPDLLVFRPSSLPLPQLVANFWKMSIPFALKTSGRGDFRDFYAGGMLRRLTRGSNEFLLRRLITNSVAIDVVSEDHAYSLKAAFPEVAGRVYRVDNGVDVDAFCELKECGIVRKKMGFSDDDNVIGYVGAFPWRRGGKEVIDVVKKFKVHQPLKGVIIGDNGDADRCREYAKALGVEDEIRVVGQVSFEEVPGFMGGMDVGVSIRRQEEQHCSELKVRQYLAAGLCVVGTQGSNDFLRGFEFARVVPDEDPEVVAEAVSSLIEGGRLKVKRRGAQAREYAKRELSIASKNVERLRIWGDALRERRK